MVVHNRLLYLALYGLVLVSLLAGLSILANASHGVVDPRYDDISPQQYDQLGEALLGVAARVTQKWGHFSTVNKTAECPHD